MVFAITKLRQIFKERGLLAAPLARRKASELAHQAASRFSFSKFHCSQQISDRRWRNQ
jgi:hypothetical protein